MKQILMTGCIVILILVSVSLSAQGYLVKEGFGIGYNIGTINVNGLTYGVNSYGVTVLGKIDFYHGFATINKKEFSATGIALYLRKNFDTKMYPAIAFSVATYENTSTIGTSFSWMCKVMGREKFYIFAAPIVNIYPGRYGGNKTFKVIFSATSSLAWNISNHFTVYIESLLVFDADIGQSISFGLLYD
jgi:hypothetical protein